MRKGVWSVMHAGSQNAVRSNSGVGEFRYKRLWGDPLSLHHLSTVSPGIAPVGAVTKCYCAPYTPPSLCAERQQAETIIVAVGISLLGLVQWNLSGIAAVRSCLDKMVTDPTGAIPGLTGQRLKNSPTPRLAISPAS